MFWVLDLVVVSGLRVPERAGTSEERGQQKLSMCFSPENWSLDLIFALHNMNQKHCESNAFEIAFRTKKIILKSLAGFAAVRTSHGIICSAHASESVGGCGPTASPAQAYSSPLVFAQTFSLFMYFYWEIIKPWIKVTF